MRSKGLGRGGGAGLKRKGRIWDKRKGTKKAERLVASWS